MHLRVVSHHVVVRVTRLVMCTTECVECPVRECPACRAGCVCGLPCCMRCVHDWPTIFLGHDLENLVTNLLSRDPKKLVFWIVLNCAFDPEHSIINPKILRLTTKAIHSPPGNQNMPLGEIPYLFRVCRNSPIGVSTRNSHRGD